MRVRVRIRTLAKRDLELPTGSQLATHGLAAYNPTKCPQRSANCRLFLSEFRRTFRSTGAILPSGRALARSLAAPVRELSKPIRILEVGPGTGAVTLAIAAAMSATDTLDLVELNDRFADHLRQRLRCDHGLTTVADRTTLHHANIETVNFERPFDVVVSGLPLNNFTSAEVERILVRLMELVRPGGELTFFEYIAIRNVKRFTSRAADRQRLSEIGAALSSLFAGHESRHEAVWTNIPPAWSHRVRQMARNVTTESQ